MAQGFSWPGLKNVLYIAFGWGLVNVERMFWRTGRGAFWFSRLMMCFSPRGAACSSSPSSWTGCWWDALTSVNNFDWQGCLRLTWSLYPFALPLACWNSMQRCQWFNTVSYVRFPWLICSFVYLCFGKLPQTFIQAIHSFKLFFVVYSSRPKSVCLITGFVWKMIQCWFSDVCTLARWSGHWYWGGESIHSRKLAPLSFSQEKNK